MKSFQRVISVILILSLLAGFVPMGEPPKAEAETPDARVVRSKDFASFPERAAELAEAGEERVCGPWRYVQIPETDYAAVTGYEGEAEALLEMPDLLEGLDVVAVAPGALSALKSLETLYIPGNVRAIGRCALPRGATVRAMNASYASAWAQENGHAFENASAYEFREGVVDLSDVRTGNFVRVSANEVWLRALEAGRLKKGSFFFLLDPANPYQISYYKVKGLSDGPDGFTVFSCETPDVDSVLYRYEGYNEPLVADLSTLTLYEGAALDSAGADEIMGSSLGAGYSAEKSLGFTGHFTEDIGDNGKLKVDIGVKKSYTCDCKVGLFTDKKTTITEKSAGTISVSLGYDFYDKYADQNKQISKAVKEFLASKDKKLFDKLDLPMANVMLFSLGGVVNVTLVVKAVLELSGEISITYEFSNTTTYTYQEGQNPTKTVKEGVSKLTGEAKVELKFGIEVELNVYVFVVKLITVSAFLGIKAKAEFKLEYSPGTNGEKGVDQAFLMETALAQMALSKIKLRNDINLNMLDCVEISVDMIVEIGFSAGLGFGKAVNFEIAAARATLLDVNLLEAHYHLFPFAYSIEPFTTEEEWAAKDSYEYTRTGLKNQAHAKELCPYDRKTVNVLLPAAEEGKQLLKRSTVDPNTMYNVPSFDFASLGLKLIGWYTDPSFTAETEVKRPYKIVGDTNFYAKTEPLHPVSFLDADGRTLDYPDLAIRENGNTTAIDTMDGRDNMVARGEQFTLPAAKPNGDAIDYWIQVVSPSDRTPVGGATTDLSALELAPGSVFKVGKKTTEEVYLCAITGRDVAAYFFTNVGGNFIPVYGKRGDTLTVPGCTDTLLRYAFDHWEDKDGNLISGSIETGPATPSRLSYYAVWEPNGAVTTLPVTDTYIGTDGANYNDQYPENAAETFYYSPNDDGSVTITGLRQSVGAHLRIPSSIDGCSVTAIASEAFRNKSSLVSVTLPGSVTSVGSYAFAGCTSLRLIDLSATKLSSLPSNFASGCGALRRVLLPVSRCLDSLGSYAFSGCSSLDAVRLSSAVGNYCFQSCTSLGAAQLRGGVTAVGSYAFSGCSSLDSLTVPDSVKSLGEYFLNGCTGLTTLTVDASVQKLETNTLYIGSGSRLETLTLGGTIAELGDKAVANGSYGFGRLTDLTLPPMLRKIGTDAFAKCAVENLTVSFATRQSLSANYVFRNMNSLRTVTVLNGAVPGYAFTGNTKLETVNLGAGVTAVADYAFSGCTALRTVSFSPDAHLQSLGTSAFSNCAALESLSVPASVSSIGDSFLAGCLGLRELRIEGSGGDVLSYRQLYIGQGAALESVTLGDGVAELGDSALANYNGSTRYGFANLETLKLGNSLRRLGSYACYGAGLRSVELGRNVTLGSYAFAGCERLTKVVMAEAVNAASLFAACPNLTELEIRGGKIGSGAFSGCAQLESVTLREGVTAIGDEAFRYCTGLTSFTIPDSVTICGQSILYGCTELRSLSVGSGIDLAPSSFNENPFYIGEGSKLETLTLAEGITTIGAYRFANAYSSSNASSSRGYGYPALKTVVFPSTLRSIGTRAFDMASLRELNFRGEIILYDNAFQRMTTLERVHIEAGEIRDNVFFGCTGLKELTLGEGVRAIGNYAFENCTGLTSFTIPDSVTSCGQSILYGCTNLRYLYVGGHVDLSGSDRGGNPFNIGSGSNLETLVLGEGITQIGAYRFTNTYGSGYQRYYFPKLTTVAFPSTLRSIGAYAFRGAPLTELELPTGCTLSSSAFSGMTTLERVRIETGAIPSRAFENCTGLTSVELGDGVTAIGDDAFRYCTGLTSFTIPDSVTSCGQSILYGCTNLRYLYVGGNVDLSGSDTVGNPFNIGSGSNLETLVLGEGITQIGAYRFTNTYGSGYQRYYFPKLTTVVFPSTLRLIGACAFQGAPLKELDFRGSITLSSSAFSGMTTLERVRIEAGAIPSNAFSGCTGLTSVELGDGVTAIGDEAFRDCTGLTSFTIPDSVTSCGPGILYGCTNLRYLYVGGNVDLSGSDTVGNPFNIGSGSNLETLVLGEGITQIGAYRFTNTYGSGYQRYYFPKLTTVVFPSTLRLIGACAFQGAPLKELDFRGSIALSSSAFSGMTTLERVRIEAGAIPSCAFENCTGLTSVELGDGVTAIGDNAFRDCTGLTSFTIPDSVTSCGPGILFGCTNLRYLYIGGNVDLPSSSFTGNPFYIGSGSKLETLVLGEGITQIGPYRLSNTYSNSGSYTHYGFPELTTVILPSTLESLYSGNLSYWGQVRHLAFGPALTGIAESGSVPAGLTLYSDGQNAALAAFAESKGLNYVVGGETPRYTLRLLVPESAAVVGASLEESDLPAGFACLSETERSFNSALLPEAPQVPAGCVFRGWYLDSALTTPLTLGVMPPRELTLYAKIDAPVEVRYLVPDESAPEGWAVYESFRLLAGEAMPAPAQTPERTHSRFTGWYAEPSCVTPWALDRVPEGGADVYAGFEGLTRIVFAVNNAAAGTPDAGLPGGFYRYASYELPVGSAFPWPADPSAEGYAFEGWFDSPALKDSYARRVVGSEEVVYYGKLSRLTPGGRYESVPGGLKLVSYRVEEDGSSILHLPSRVNGLPVVSIGAFAFTAGGVDTLCLPDTLRSVDPEAFTDSGIFSLVIGRAAENFKTVNGVLFSKDGTELLYYPAARHSESYAIPAGVTRIAARAFRNNPYLKSVIFSDTLEEIGAEAFSGCAALESVSLPASTTTLRAGAFAGCAALESFTAYGLTTIESGANGRVETIPRAVASVFGPLGEGVLRDWFLYTSSGGAYSFQYNQYLLTLSLDDETETITSEAGLPLTGELSDVRFEDGSFVEAWYRDEALTLPWDLAADTMPAAALTLYGTRTPLYTYENGTVTVGETEYTGLILTGYNGKAASLTVPAALGGEAVIGLGVGFLAQNTTVTTLTLGAHILSIAEGALSGFTGTLVCDADSAAAAWAEGRGLTLRAPQYTLRFETEGETVAPRQAAKGTALRLPTLTNAYRGFLGWCLDAECEIPAVLDDDGLYTMPGADTTLYAHWDRETESVPFTWTAVDGAVTITGYTGAEEDVTIPETVNGWPVTAVGESAFAGNTHLESVALGAVTEVGDYAFADCARLRTVDFGESLVSLGDGAFARCAALGSLELPDSLTSLGEGAFADCTGLKTLTLGAGLESFPLNALALCERLSAVNAPAANAALSSVDGVLYNKDATSLLLYPRGRAAESFAVPNGVTALGESAFEGAAALRTVTLPNSMTALGRAAFAGSGLASFTASNLLEIGENAFQGCAALTSVEPGEELQSLGSMAFAGCEALTAIRLPASAVLDAEDIYFSSPSLVITGTLGSSAHTYAQAHRILFSDPDAIGVTAVTLNIESMVLERGESLQLTASLTPDNANDGTDIRWYSSDSAVAMVDQNGLVSAMGGGTAEIVAESANGLSASCVVEVTVSVRELRLDMQSLFLTPEEAAQLTAEILPGSATDKTLVWTSGDESVVSVDENGFVTALAPGQTLVTATAHNGLSQNVTVTVYLPAEPMDLNLIPGQRARLPLPEGLADGNGEARCALTSSGSGLSVDDHGVLTANDAGTYTVSLMAEDRELGRHAVTVAALNTLSLPAALTAIEEEAFRGDEALERVVLGENVTGIGSRAFAETPALRQAVIPANVTELAPNAFENAAPTLLVTENSAAQTFAQTLGLPYAFITED